ncbi:MAG TPA: hypothetical protein VFQ77_04000 [Pseudonocardiaceae bacterium]|jgi:hypothetical protein|nr:hypothetical protein [Pseudonocardiaceae bacterium]
MTTQQVGHTAPEVVALCGLDTAQQERVVGWAMLVANRVVTYIPDHPRLPGGMLLTTFSSLDAVDRELGHADIYSVRDWPRCSTHMLPGAVQPARGQGGQP